MAKLMQHYSKLSDENRNKTFWNVLKECDLEHKRVFVIGDELLALFAMKSGASKVYICNENKMMTKLLENNKHIIIIKKNIFNCKLKDFGNKKVDVILSDWMGICLFHGRKLESVIYARDKFLTRNGLLLPSKAQLCVSLIENNEKREDNDDDLEFWKTNGENHDQDFKELYDIDISHMHTHAVKDFYTHIIAQRVVKDNIISNTIEYDFDLNNIQKKELRKFVLPLKQFKIMKQTLLAGVCFHFKTEFYNFNGDYIDTLTTEPGIYNHWKHGIAYFSNLLPIDKGVECDIKVEYKINDEKSYNITSELMIDENRYIKTCNTNVEYI